LIFSPRQKFEFRRAGRVREGGTAEFWIWGGAGNKKNRSHKFMTPILKIVLLKEL